MTTNSDKSLSYLPSPWPNKRAVGSSYCLDQAPSAERFGGLTVTLRPRTGPRGTITATATHWLQSRTLDAATAEFFAEAARKGIYEAAAECHADINELDVELSQFAYHPTILVNRCSTWRGSAFRSAWDGWCRFGS